eukprot:CAMPEP_0194056024 /NCGR_PEP_ID=MMETSP0009_2-20130614/58767_1 /TAXON_ID=210454 /ORGANISM="Grammatophora oceanica, Strain CCMP 410" /LENGTH=173 /DNA_ID=CAMNT_0038705209 /DNA_START=603 /DNA_END=1124 /DNA_ORIENTATION=-
MKLSFVAVLLLSLASSSKVVVSAAAPGRARKLGSKKSKKGGVDDDPLVCTGDAYFLGLRVDYKVPKGCRGESLVAGCCEERDPESFGGVGKACIADGGAWIADADGEGTEFVCCDPEILEDAINDLDVCTGASGFSCLSPGDGLVVVRVSDSVTICCDIPSIDEIVAKSDVCA